MSEHTSDSNLSGRVILVTGASRGIGAAIAETCAARGAKLILVSRKLEGLEEVAARIQAAGGDAHCVACHMGDAEQVKTLFAGAAKTFGPVTGLVNNAATNPYFGPALGISDGAWDKTFEVNVKGYFTAIREFLAVLEEEQNASIVNVASVAGMRAAPFQGVYGMTKAAVISMTKTLAFELGGRGVRVNAVCPGLIETKFASAIVKNDSLRDQVVARTAAARHGQPVEIAGAVAYLLSGAASYVTGHSMVIDGGMTAA